MTFVFIYFILFIFHNCIAQQFYENTKKRKHEVIEVKFTPQKFECAKKLDFEYDSQGHIKSHQITHQCVIDRKTYQQYKSTNCVIYKNFKYFWDNIFCYNNVSYSFQSQIGKEEMINDSDFTKELRADARNENDVYNFIKQGFNYWPDKNQHIGMLERQIMSYAFDRDKRYLIVHATGKILIVGHNNDEWKLIRVYNIKSEHEDLCNNVQKLNLKNPIYWPTHMLKIAFNKDVSCFALIDKKNKCNFFALKEPILSNYCLNSMYVQRLLGN